MQIGSDQWCATLMQSLNARGIQLTSQQLDQISLHAQSLVEWNCKINLTAITDPGQMVVKHYIDTILPSGYIPLEGHLLDMGTGGGFPGIPLKILRPDQPMTLVDASRKKISFIKHIIRQLGLKNITAHQVRVEQMPQGSEYKRRFQVIVSRAFTQLNHIIKLAFPLLTDDGVIVTYQGPDEHSRKLMPEHIANLKVSMAEYYLPGSNGRRALVFVKP